MKIKDNFDLDASFTNHYNDPSHLNTRIGMFKHANNSLHYMDWLADKYSFSLGQKILDVGCGTGQFWQHVQSDSTKLEIELTDTSPNMLQATQSISALKGQSRSLQSMSNLQFLDNTFDVVVAHFILYHADDITHALKELQRVSKVGGHIGIATMASKPEDKLWSIVHDVCPRVPDRSEILPRFCCENAKVALSTATFSKIKSHSYTNFLISNDPHAWVEFVLSFPTVHDRYDCTEIYEALYQRFNLEIEERGEFSLEARLCFFDCIK